MRILYSMSGLLKMVVDSQSLPEGSILGPQRLDYQIPTRRQATTLAHVQVQTRRWTRSGVKLTTKEAVGNVAVSMATTAEKRAKMARYADVHGLQAAAKHFSAKLG